MSRNNSFTEIRIDASILKAFPIPVSVYADMGFFLLT